MKQIIFISIFIFWNYLCFGATTFNTDSLQRRMSLFGTMLPQEKVYVHLDNTATSWAIRFGTKDTSHEATKEH